MTLGDGILQLTGVIFTAVVTYGVARLTRRGSREINQISGWSTLVAALQKQVAELETREDNIQDRVKELDQGNKDLSRRIYVLERSRHRWKGWGQRVVEIMSERGIIFPTPPEPLDDTDPNMKRNY